MGILLPDSYWIELCESIDHKDLPGFQDSIRSASLDDRLKFVQKQKLFFESIIYNLKCGTFTDPSFIKSIVDAKADLNAVCTNGNRLLLACLNDYGDSVRRLRTFEDLVVSGASLIWKSPTKERVPSGIIHKLLSHNSVNESNAAWEVLRREKEETFSYPKILDILSHGQPLLNAKSMKAGRKIRQDIAVMVTLLFCLFYSFILLSHGFFHQESAWMTGVGLFLKCNLIIPLCDLVISYLPKTDTYQAKVTNKNMPG